MERLLARRTWPGCRALAVEQGSEHLAPLPADDVWELRRYGQATLALWLAPED